MLIKTDLQNSTIPLSCPLIYQIQKTKAQEAKLFPQGALPNFQNGTVPAEGL